MSGPTLQTRQCIDIPSRSLMVLNAKATIDKHMEGGTLQGGIKLFVK